MSQIVPCLRKKSSLGILRLPPSTLPIMDAISVQSQMRKTFVSSLGFSIFKVERVMEMFFGMIRESGVVRWGFMLGGSLDPTCLDDSKKKFRCRSTMASICRAWFVSCDCSSTNCMMSIGIGE